MHVSGVNSRIIIGKIGSITERGCYVGIAKIFENVVNAFRGYIYCIRRVIGILLIFIGTMKFC